MCVCTCTHVFLHNTKNRILHALRPDFLAMTSTPNQERRDGCFRAGHLGLEISLGRDDYIGFEDILPGEFVISSLPHTRSLFFLSFSHSLSLSSCAQMPSYLIALRYFCVWRARMTAADALSLTLLCSRARQMVSDRAVGPARLNLTCTPTHSLTHTHTHAHT